MSVVTVDSSRTEAVTSFLGGSFFLDLFINDVFPGLDDEFINYQTLGIGFLTIGFSDWTISAPGTQGEIRATATKTFIVNQNRIGVPVYGYFVYESTVTGPNLLWAERLGEAPFTIIRIGAKITVILNLLFQ